MHSQRSASIAGTASAPLGLTFDRLASLRDVLARTHMRWLVAILVVGLALRLVWVVAVQPDPRDGRFDDTVWYYNTARHLAAGDGYVFPGDTFCAFGDTIGCDELPPTALWAPGYSIALATLLNLPGDDVAYARALNLAAGLALLVGVYYLGSRLWDRRAGLLAAGIMALFPGHIFFSSLVLSETLFVALAIGLLALALAWTAQRDVAPWRVVALGVAAGAVALVRPEGLVFASAVVLAWLAVHRSWRRTAQHTALLIAGIAVLVVPWGVRNAVQLDAPVFGTTGLGQVLIQAHHEDADGQPEFWIASELWQRHAAVPLPEREVRVNNTGIRESVEYVLDHPGDDLALVPERFAAFYRGDRGGLIWNGVQDRDGGSALSESAAGAWGAVADGYYYAVLAVALLALPLWLRRSDGRHLLLWAPFLAYSAMWAFLFVGEPRYHLPLLPVFALVAAIGLAAAWGRLTPDREEAA